MKDKKREETFKKWIYLLIMRDTMCYLTCKVNGKIVKGRTKEDKMIIEVEIKVSFHNLNRATGHSLPMVDDIVRRYSHSVS